MLALFDSVTASFTVRTLVDPNVVDRLVQVLARQDLAPACVRPRRYGERLTVAIQQPAVSEKRAVALADEMRGLALVESVSLECELPASKRRFA